MTPVKQLPGIADKLTRKQAPTGKRNWHRPTVVRIPMKRTLESSGDTGNVEVEVY